MSADQDILKLKNKPRKILANRKAMALGGNLTWDVCQQVSTFLTCSTNRTNFRQYLPTPETNKDFPASSCCQ